MKNFVSCLMLVLVVGFGFRATAQKNSTQASAAPLVLTGSIPLPNVQGRIDHFAFDPDNRLFLSALGNNTAEVIDLSAQRVIHTITGVPRPQGVVYSPETNKLFVASDEGKVYIYDGSSFGLITTIDFHDDADNLRYDPADKRVYVGYGDGESAAIGMIDATTNKRLDEEYKVGAHPESFQLESAGPDIFANVPDLKQIVVIDRKTREIKKWALTLESNFPMALDEADRRLFIATRVPPRMAVVSAESGRVLAALPCVQDSDDIYYDAARKRIYVTGGEGYISVFQQKDADHYELLAKVPSALGARTAGYFGKIGKKAFDRLYVAVPARAKREAEVWIYTVQD
ncbi:MAG TPA: YncE family protein [Candidatus Sulfotelmatobacter sp.]|nr:YncE family protein [Candidatus Sulfotelmatobacter sp.]